MQIKNNLPEVSKFILHKAGMQLRVSGHVFKWIAYLNHYSPFTLKSPLVTEYCLKLELRK